ncbi:MAG: polysaccharide deacetylase family protein [Bacteroidia bacterium]|nr:polysaccharide deacetylase family protein [Bacteroidia bacterium]
MKITPVKTPLIAKKLFSNYIWEIPSDSKTLYLTFDDGPTPEITDWTLSKLKEYKAKATFFCVGNNIAKHPDLFENILHSGHKIGNHTYNHLKGWRTSTKNYLSDINKTQHLIDLIMKIKVDNAPLLFRPPYGQIRPKQGKALNELGFKVVMWNVLSFDWNKEVSKESCLENVLSNAKEGSIVVFHDSIKAEKNMRYALPKVLDHYSKIGFDFKSIDPNS